MKIKNILAITALVGLGMTAQAAPITFTFLVNGATPNTSVGNSYTFTSGGASLTATASSGQSIFVKDGGAGEQGLGIVSDPTGNNEIYGSTFIQLLSSTSSGGFAIDTIGLSSVSGGEIATVYFSTVLGVLGAAIGNTSADGTFNVLSAYQNGYIGVAASGTSIANVLVGPVTGHVPDGGTTVAMLGGALTALGLIRRKLVA